MVKNIICIARTLGRPILLPLSVCEAAVCYMTTESEPTIRTKKIVILGHLYSHLRNGRCVARLNKSTRGERRILQLPRTLFFADTQLQPTPRNISISLMHKEIGREIFSTYDVSSIAQRPIVFQCRCTISPQTQIPPIIIKGRDSVSIGRKPKWRKVTRRCDACHLRTIIKFRLRSNIQKQKAKYKNGQIFFNHAKISIYATQKLRMQN